MPSQSNLSQLLTLLKNSILLQIELTQIYEFEDPSQLTAFVYELHQVGMKNFAQQLRQNHHITVSLVLIERHHLFKNSYYYILKQGKRNTHHLLHTVITYLYFQEQEYRSTVGYISYNSTSTFRKYKTKIRHKGTCHTMSVKILCTTL